MPSCIYKGAFRFDFSYCSMIIIYFKVIQKIVSLGYFLWTLWMQVGIFNSKNSSMFKIICKLNFSFDKNRVFSLKSQNCSKLVCTKTPNCTHTVLDSSISSESNFGTIRDWGNKNQVLSFSLFHELYWPKFRSKCKQLLLI